MGVAREETVKIGFDIDDNPLKSLIDDIEKLKKKLTSALGGDEFDDLKDNAKKAKAGIDNVTSSVNKTKSAFDKSKSSAEGLNSSVKKVSNHKMTTLNSGLEQVKKKLTAIGEKASGTVYAGLKKIAGLSFKGLSIGLGAAATGIGVIAKNAVAAYGEYEQLIGGVETLFKNDSKTIVKYANDAYKTSGLSANDYMETVTGFSASLIQSLGGDTKKAAELGNMAIVDMAD